jgi:gamma-glutamyltranspeptidase/glutathione hydrolase
MGEHRAGSIAAGRPAPEDLSSIVHPTLTLATRMKQIEFSAATSRGARIPQRCSTAAFLIMTFLLEGCAPHAGRPAAALEIPRHMSATGTQGMVVSDAPLATRTGVEVLRSGGNAIDAAVAAAFSLAVVYPEAGNIGGGGYIIGCFSDGTSAALDFRETAPLAASRDMFLDPAGNMTGASESGPVASGVPGLVAGLWEAHRKYGRLPWNQILEPAILLAREGFAVDDRFARTLRSDSSRLARYDGSRKLFFSDGRPLQQGTIWKNPDLAATLERIAEQGEDGFYRGETANRIVEEMKRGGGLITVDDLEQYRARWRRPIKFMYRRHRVVCMPPSSSGGATLAIMANILDGFDLRAMGWHSPDAVHFTAEAMRRAFADRNEYLGDQDVVHVPLDSLLSDEHAAHWRATIHPRKATPSHRIAHGTLIPLPEGTETTHLSVVDADGNAVALTTTLNFLYGSGVVVDGAGFLLNDEMDDFASKPGWPNSFGLIQGESNAIAPGKRMLSSMTPVIVCDSLDRPFLITGARGGPQIITAVFQVLSNMIDYSMDPVSAVTAPRMHHQHYPDVLLYEEGALDSLRIGELMKRNHELKKQNGLGSTCSITRTGSGWVGIGDPRSGGSAEGY